MNACRASTSSPSLTASSPQEYVSNVMQWLAYDGIQTVDTCPDGPMRPGGVHVGSMHRFESLDYQRVVIAGASDGLVRRRAIDRLQDDDPKRCRQERAETNPVLRRRNPSMRPPSRLFGAATAAPSSWRI
ncbi:hypothetical protein ACQP2Y_03535 [Actinoplanes sp. CA-051413]|uniref:hypothetical protein n=1 Tax=Actinoplanes sp. CA-051413 TaxID=3239899 RepID=UPI003D991E5E